MGSLKLPATLVLTVVLALLGASSAEASTPHQSSVSGFEFYATASEGRFSGTARGVGPNGLWGAWAIVVQHSSLDPCFQRPSSEGPCAWIDSGSFSLAEVSPTRELVTGAFDSRLEAATAGQADAITLLRTGPCTDESFSIVDGLKEVGSGAEHSGTGSFSATLTHYRRSIFGRCVTYAATVSGQVTLIY